MKTPVVAAFVCLSASIVCGSPRAEAAGPEDVAFAASEGFELAGTLLLPEGASAGRPAPGVLLLPGSGPTDRDGNQGPLRTDLLRQLAEGLAAEGIASLRFDKRALPSYAAHFPPPEEMGPFFRLDRFADDAARAMALLAARPEVAGDRLGVFGHSEGGVIALLLAASDEPPASVVLAATPGRPVADVIREQIGAQLAQAPEAMRTQGLEALDGAFAAIDEGRRLPDDLPAWLAPLFNPSTVGIMKDYIRTDPAALAGRVGGPVLVINGAADVQVSPEKDAARLAAALRERADAETDLTVLEGVSHNLKAVAGEADPGFVGPVAPGAMDAIVGWFARTLAAD